MTWICGPLMAPRREWRQSRPEQRTPCHKRPEFPQFRDALAWLRHLKTPVTCPAVACPACRDLQRWLARARRARLDDERIEALFASTVGPPLLVRADGQINDPPGRSRRPAWKTWPRGSAAVPQPLRVLLSY
jgi:hypothetical protein